MSDPAISAHPATPMTDQPPPAPGPRPYYDDGEVTLYLGDAVDVLAGLPAASVDCTVTSPPYWGLRDYGTAMWAGGDPNCRHTASRSNTAGQTTRQAGGDPASAAHPGVDPATCPRCGASRADRQYGLEPTPEGYVEHLRAVFAELARVLVPAGTVWLNLGDCYSSDPPGHTTDPMRASTLAGRAAAAARRESFRRAGVHRTTTLPRKNLVGMPWRVAFALQADGWVLRSAVIWHKPNAMPESVRDRLSSRYETVFLLVRQPRYYFNLDTIREPLAESALTGGSNSRRA